MKSAKGNSDRKPVLGRLTARPENKLLTLKLHNGYKAKLRLLVSKERIKKFLEWRNYEIAIDSTEKTTGPQYTSRRLLTLRKAKPLQP
ncbi:hypothetical protein Desfe_0828 [Desulfurococcus amylolyticus DSM 16532]|uniref:Uncharacterized protein n=1 Tax=Desulfurococcus amylolyticus DSM 16532 TaxID=768672 RepID=I3XRZ5_DESAM|nr:hypothetical protein Desfe_0828 [Desulfurococcus amylolyticus DSM 16532]